MNVQYLASASQNRLSLQCRVPLPRGNLLIIVPYFEEILPKLSPTYDAAVSILVWLYEPAGEGE